MKTLALLASVVFAFSAAAQDTMKAIQATAFGGPEVLKLEDVAKPVPRDGEALVRVFAAGVNPVDWKIREGKLQGMTPPPPFIPGYDVAGVIDSMGPSDGGTKLKLGDSVYAYLALTAGGGYAEYVCVPLKTLAKKPQKANWSEAAATPLAALTAWQALFDQAKLQPGQTVLIHGAAGGVGHFAVQFAKAKGAKVIATASSANHEFLKSLGATVLIDYKTSKFEEVIKPGEVDVVLDTIGGDTQTRSLALIRKGGTLVSIVQPPDAAKCKELGINGKVFLVQPSGTQLAEIAKLIDENKVTPHVSAELPLAEAAKAQDMSKSGTTRGKIVLKVR